MRLLWLALLLAACASDAPPSASGPAEALDPNALVLSPRGVARLGAETPFDTVAVRAALPAGFAVELHGGQSGEPAIWALRDGQILFEVYGAATVTRVEAPNADVAGPGGARPGQSFAEAGGEAMDCEIGTGRLADLAVCRRDGLGYVFASAAFVGQTEMPEAPADAFLERIVWRADG